MTLIMAVACSPSLSPAEEIHMWLNSREKICGRWTLPQPFPLAKLPGPALLYVVCCAMFVLKKHIFCLKGSNIHKNAFSLYYPSTHCHFPPLQGRSELCPGSQAPREHLQCLPVQMIYGCSVRSIQTHVWINEWFVILLSDYRCLLNMKRGKIDRRGNVLLCLRIQ